MAARYIDVAILCLLLGNVITSVQRCPFYMDIAPCLCTDSQLRQELVLDCSHVVDIDQLMRIFQAEFPTTNFSKLMLIGSPDDPVHLHFLPDGVFGNISFQEIIIDHTQIQRVDEYAFISSKVSLMILRFTHSELKTFPTTILPLLSSLRELDLAFNDIAFIPDLHSSSLQSLSLAHNKKLSFTDQVFSKLHHIVDLNLGYCNINTLPSNMFLSMMNLSTIYLQHNSLTHLSSGSLHFTSNFIEEIDLSENLITYAEENFLSGGGHQIYLELLSNNITKLIEETWRPVFQMLSDPGDGMVILDSNPLDCGCNLAWLLTSPTLLKHLARGATCTNGTAIHDLDATTFEHICSV